MFDECAPGQRYRLTALLSRFKSSRPLHPSRTRRSVISTVDFKHITRDENSASGMRYQEPALADIESRHTTFLLKTPSNKDIAWRKFLHLDGQSTRTSVNDTPQRPSHTQKSVRFVSKGLDRTILNRQPKTFAPTRAPSIAPPPPTLSSRRLFCTHNIAQ